MTTTNEYRYRAADFETRRSFLAGLPLLGPVARLFRRSPRRRRRTLNG